MVFLVLLLSLQLALVASTVLHEPVDLTRFEETLIWEDDEPFSYLAMNFSTKSGQLNEAQSLAGGIHIGTHMDAPVHCYSNRWQIEDIPVERFTGKGVYVNLREHTKMNPDFQVFDGELELWEKQHGQMPLGAVVLLDFGWGDKYRNEEEYFGTKDMKNRSSFHFPGLSSNGAKWLFWMRKVIGVATDTPSIDYGQTQNNAAQKSLAFNNVYIIEQVAYPVEPLPPRGFSVMTIPMKIANSTGAPCRIVAIP